MYDVIPVKMTPVTGRLEETTSIAVTSLVHTVLSGRELEMASSGASGTDTVDTNKDNGILRSFFFLETIREA